MRPVDADNIIKRCDQYQAEDECNGTIPASELRRRAAEYREVRFVVDTEPTLTSEQLAQCITPIQIVRCKDCLYYRLHEEYDFKYCVKYKIGMSGEDFCSRGIKKGT